MEKIRIETGGVYGDVVMVVMVMKPNKGKA